MASGDEVVAVISVGGPATLAAPLSIRAGGSTPAEQNKIFAFDAATIWYRDFHCELSPSYSGGGLTFRLKGSAASATTNEARMGLAIRRLADDAEDSDTSHTYDFNYLDITAPSVAGELTYDEIAFTSGADMDSLAAGETFILRVTREATHANDDMAGNFELWGPPVGRET